MKGFFKRDERKAYFKLTKLKLFGDERRGMRRKVVRQIGRMKVKGRMGKNERNKEGGVTIRHHPFICTPCNYEFVNNSMVFLLNYYYYYVEVTFFHMKV
jgi:hypothetical protein